MDELTSQLKTTVLNPENDENKGFESLYKNWGKLSNQEQRRKDILEIQRGNRNSNLDTCRGILEIVNEVEERKSHNYRAQSRYRPSIYVAGFTKTSTSYRDVLMMSEWMVEKPEDFNENWYVVPCPKGVRTLVVANNGVTKLYTKYGHYRKSCRTALPGGNPCTTSSKSRCVVLDCFHSEVTNTLYVLDLLAWNSQPMTDGETEFRHYWMKTQIEEIPALKTINTKNKILFELLPKVECSKESFNKFMMTMPHFKNGVPILDGLLFYHKLAHYVSGMTPLVGWLFPFMVNEVLGSDVTVNPGYLAGKPNGYIDQARYIHEFEIKLQKKLPKFARTSISMDTSSETDDTKSEKATDQQENKNNDSEMVTETETSEQRKSNEPNDSCEPCETNELSELQPVTTQASEPSGWQPTTTTYKPLSQHINTTSSLLEVTPSIELDEVK